MRLLTSLCGLLVLAAFQATADERLFEPAREVFARVSPDGNRLGVVARDDDGFIVDAIDLETTVRETFFATSSLGDGEFIVAAMTWVDNDTLVLRIIEITEGIAKLSDTRNKQHNIVIDAVSNAPKVRYIKTEGTLIDALPVEENKVLFARSGSTSIVYRIDTSKLYEWGKQLPKTARVDGGQFVPAARVAEVEGYVLRWLTASDGYVRAALKIDEDGAALMIRERDSVWEVEKAWPAEVDDKSNRRSRKSAQEDEEGSDRFYVPIALIENTRDFVVRASDENDRDGVYRYNYKTSEKTLVYRHPTAEIVSAGLSRDNSDVLYASYFEDGVVKFHYVEGAYREVADKIMAIHPEYIPMIGATDLSESRFLVVLSSPVQPGRVFTYRRETGELTHLYDVMPWLDESSLSMSTAATVVSDGLDIEYFLTMPGGSQKVPLVVYPHGGPWAVGDNREFSPVVQYLSSLGVAVLQVNYRGSGGYGDEFLEEGFGEFGRRMLDDIEAAMNDALGNPAIDDSRICTIGESYGGYAALMLAVRSPTRYVCAASYAGVTDLGLLLGSYDADSADFLLELLTGDAGDRDSVYENLKNLSPLYSAEQLTIPVLLVHGDADTRVDIEHSYRMEARLRRLGKDITWHALEGQHHRLSNADEALSYYRLLADFLREHLTEH